MAEENPFELEGRNGGPERPHGAKKEWTDEEKAEKLSGYVEIAPEYWEHIKYGTHMRYITKAGEFRPGGFVLKNPFDTKAKGGPEKRFIKLQNGFNDKIRGYAQWIAAYEDIARVYIKPDAGVLMMLTNLQTSVKSLNDNIQKIAIYAKKLEERLSAVEHHLQLSKK